MESNGYYGGRGPNVCECGQAGDCYDADGRLVSDLYADADEAHERLVRIGSQLECGGEGVNPTEVSKTRALLKQIDKRLATYCEEL